jgi:Ni/Fe-hydrogenase subunit HybB-like protein
MKRALIILGVVLLIFGIAAVLHPTYTYHKQEQVAKIGAFQATVDEEKTAQVPPVAIAAAIVSGLALVLIGSKMKS